MKTSLLYHLSLRITTRSITVLLHRQFYTNMAQAATASAPININSIIKEPSTASSSSSLPSSPSEIINSWIAPEIPKTIKASFAAWIRQGDGGASAELNLYQRSGFFKGATLNNAANTDIETAFKEASEVKSTVSESPASHLNPDSRATVGTSLNVNGKIGCIRKIDIGNEGPASWFSNPTPRLINMLEIGTPLDTPPENEEKIVLLHGYGAGTAFFFQNIASLGKRENSRLFALDWLGMGRSARVPFHISHQDIKETSTRVEAAESFFVQALEDWRVKVGIEKMTLVAHSLGGYLSIAYSLKHPDRVSRLVLVSPAGISETPSEGSTFSPKGNGGKTVEAEVTQPQKDHIPGSKLQAEKDAEKMKTMASKSQSPKEAERNGNQPPRIGSKTRAIFTYLWEKNASPFGLIRGSLFFGPMLVGRYTSRRFGSLPEEELRSLHNYCQAIFSARGSSEYCLAHLLAPGAFARLPMVSRISALPKTLPVSYLYGSQDWMDVKGGRESVNRLAKAGNSLGSSFVVDNSGHHIYLDNPKAFDSLLKRILDGQADGISR